MIKNKVVKIDGINFKDLEWDTKHFGLKSCLIDITKQLNDIDVINIENLIKGYEFVTIKINKSYSNSNILIGNNTKFYLIDINIQFKKEIFNYEINPKYKLEFEDQILNINEIICIAKNSFKYSRFIKDINLDINKSKEVYVEWIRNSLENSNKFFIINRNKDEKINGFILVQKYKKDELIIELIAIDEYSKRKGIGSMLFKKLEWYAFKNNISKIKVGTQIDNIEAMNFYNKCGFKIEDVTYIYHKVKRYNL